MIRRMMISTLTTTAVAVLFLLFSSNDGDGGLLFFLPGGGADAAFATWSSATSRTTTKSNKSSFYHPFIKKRSESTSTTRRFQSSGPESTGLPVITLQDVSCSHDGGATYQLQNVNYILHQGSRVGLVGRNGCGKSTLLKLLASKAGVLSSSNNNKALQDQVASHTGTITLPKSIRVAFVEQEPPMPSTLTVTDALLGYDGEESEDDLVRRLSEGRPPPIGHVVRNYLQAIPLAESDPEFFAKVSSEMDEYFNNNGAAEDCWTVLTRMEQMATKLHVAHLQKQTLDRLSGGERKRVALAAALIQDPDVLLLDEPTNHLDLAAIRWLQSVLLNKNPRDGGGGGGGPASANQKSYTLLFVTHDRAFLDDVCTSILELDRGSMYTFPGAYANYLQGKQERLVLEDTATTNAQRKYKTELEWIRRQPLARESKSKSRIKAFSKLKQATKPRVADPNLRIDYFDKNGSGQRRLGGKVMRMRNVSLSFVRTDDDDDDNNGKQKNHRVMLDKFTYDFHRNDKIGIVGPNGVGKSTFLKVLAKELQPDSGKVDHGPTVVLGLYDQMGLQVEDEQQTVLHYVTQQVEAQQQQQQDSTTTAAIPEAEARQLLRQFEFHKDRWNDRVNMLSGGERRRLQLLSVLSKNPNILILDEPSNDMDLNTLTALETFLLQDFFGVLLVVSHDRYFTDKVTNHLFVFEGDGQVKDFMGTLSEYADCLLLQEEEQRQQQLAETKQQNTFKQRDKVERFEKQNTLKKSKREMNRLEKEMEERIKPQIVKLEYELEEKSTTGEEDWTVLAELTKQLNAATEKLEEKEMRWLELAELVETLEAENAAGAATTE